MEWLNRMKDAIDWIEIRLTKTIDIDEVAKQAYSSSFHFQRLFHMITGVTVREYIRKRRLTLAAQDLAMSNQKVIEISLKYGYESPESFAKAFRKAHGISPSDARKQGVQLKAFPRITFHLSLKGDQDMDYRIVNRDAFQVIGRSIRVSFQNGENNRSIPAFWQTCYGDGTVEKLRQMNPNQTLYGICMNTDHQKEIFTYVIAAETHTETNGESKEEGWTVHTVPASTWAVFPSTGALPQAIQNVWKRVFEEWFPATGYQHAGGPELEVLPPGDDLTDTYQCEVWIPIVKA